MKSQTARILVVDDDESVCAALAAVLSSEQHTVQVSLSAADALASAADFQPEIAIVDVNMPGSDGSDLCGLLRARHPAMRVILHTGQDPDALGVRARDAHLVIQKGSVLAFLTKFRAFLAH